jgi:hypothetical protein
MGALIWFLGCALLVSLILNVVLFRGALGLFSEVGHDARVGERQRQAANRSYYILLRRELAQVILTRERQRYERCFDKMRSWISEISGNKDLQDSELKLLTTRYPDIEDLDVIGLKHFIGNNYIQSSIDELCDRFIDICKLIVLTSYSGEDAGEFSEKDYSLYCTKYRDVDLKREDI